MLQDYRQPPGFLRPGNTEKDNNHKQQFQTLVSKTANIVAIKQLNLEGLQGNQEFIVKILLDNDFNLKILDFGLAKFGPVGDTTHVNTQVMGTYGCCQPEYAMSEKLTLKSDIYSFGVVLLELISGRKATDCTKKPGEHNLSHHFLKDGRKFVQMVDPKLEGHIPIRCLHHAVAIAAMCLWVQPSFRAIIDDIVVALEYLSSQVDNLDSHKAWLCNQGPASPFARDVNREPRKKDFINFFAAFYLLIFQAA
ncbi:hypothetical protein ACH5RR_035340 [Cinchona calisaya]|uniref:Protein kinase domain-containing protein n=1 Tax=Cinchona calisaya TaxID=153742 RepID=A0ABD2YDK2_9GENT